MVGRRQIPMLRPRQRRSLTTQANLPVSLSETSEFVSLYTTTNKPASHIPQQLLHLPSIREPLALPTRAKTAPILSPTAFTHRPSQTRKGKKKKGKKDCTVPRAGCDSSKQAGQGRVGQASDHVGGCVHVCVCVCAWSSRRRAAHPRVQATRPDRSRLWVLIERAAGLRGGRPGVRVVRVRMQTQHTREREKGGVRTWERHTGWAARDGCPLCDTVR
jgi:hypothetical protein